MKKELVAIPLLEVGARTGKSTTDLRAGIGIGDDGDPMYTLQATKQHGVFHSPEVAIFQQSSMKGKGTIGFEADAKKSKPAKTQSDGKVAPTLLTDHPSRPSDYCPVIFAQNQMGEVRTGNKVGTLNTNANASGRNTPMVLEPVVFQQNSRSEVRVVGGDKPVAGAVTSEPGAQCQNYLYAGSVRRLVPRECERLQGFSDDYTLIPYRLVKKRRNNYREKGDVYQEIAGQLWLMSSDGPRYKALGNSMAVPCMSWIGMGIQMVEQEDMLGDLLDTTQEKEENPLSDLL